MLPFVSNPSWSEHKLCWSGFWTSHGFHTTQGGCICKVVGVQECRSALTLVSSFSLFFLMWHDVS